MKRFAALAVVISALAITNAFAEEAFVVEGQVTAPNPGSKVIGGITELVNPCGEEDPDLGDVNGLDGYWIELPAGAGGKAATLESDGLDMDVWFYTGGCSLITDDADPIAYGMATDLTANESGTIPASAVYAVVDLALGAHASFKFTIPVPAA